MTAPRADPDFQNRSIVTSYAQHSTQHHEERISSAFMMRVFWVFTALALLSVAISLGGKWIGRSIAMAGHTDQMTVHTVTIGDATLKVPANMIRFERARHDGPTDRLDLYLRWPQMEGYTHEARADFNHQNGRNNIIFLSFEEQLMSQDMSGRLQPVYRTLIQPSGRSGPGDLEIHDFTEASGYRDELLVVGRRNGHRPFVARCLAGDAARDTIAPCERDVHLGQGLSLNYRFPATLAGQWQELDAAIVEAASDLVVR
jgi:hypothetical protein